MRIFFISTIILSAFFSCTKETAVQGPQGPAGVQGPNGIAPTDTGSILGKISLYNEFSIVLNDFSGVIVTLTSGNLTVKDTSDFSGYYRCHGIPIGTYNLSFEYPGYGTYKIFGLSHIPSGAIQTKVQDVSLLQIPVKTAVVNLSSTSNYNYTTLFIYLDTTSLNYVQYYQNFMILVGRDSSVNPNDYIKKYDFANPDPGGGYNYPISMDELRASFHPGETAYVRAATYNRYVFGSPSMNFMLDLGQQVYYADPSTGNYVFPNMSLSSDVVKIPM